LKTYDVVVVGAGISGSVAALRLAQGRRSVALLDAADDPSAGGNTALSGGGLHIARLSLDAKPARLLRRMLYAPAGVVREELAEAMANNAARAFAWLIDQGAQFEPESPGDIAYHFAPHRHLDNVHAWPDRGPQRILQLLQERCRAAGGKVLGGVRARELTREPGGELTVVTEEGNRVSADAVVLADGGFQANVELRRRFLGPSSDQIFLRANTYGRGDGLLMAESLGAQLSNTELFYGHCLHRDVVHNDRLWPWPALDELLTDGGILVDRLGHRITDEGLGGPAAANVVARLADPLSTFVIVDERLWQHADEVVWGHLATNRELTARGATILRGADAPDLADDAGIDPAGLQATMVEYNRALEADKGASLPVPRTGSSAPLTGELLALPLIPGITHSLGGAVVDRCGEVLDTNNEPIPGLYAAGPTGTGPHGAYFGGLATGLIQGMLAAETITASADSHSL
jgi:fumarate reductase flavoprotein subunit